MNSSDRKATERSRTGCAVILIILLSAALLLAAALTMGDVMLCVIGTARQGAIAAECHIASLLLVAVSLGLALIALLLRYTRWGA